MSTEDYDPELYWALERVRLFLTLHTVPKTGRFVSKIESQDDYHLYLWGVQIATSLEIPGFTLQTDLFEEAMQDDNVKSMAIIAEAQDDVRRARTEGISARAKNVASVLAAKRYLETSTGELPKRKDVIAMAARLHFNKFGIPTQTAADDIKEWLVVFEQAGLEYVPTGK